MRTFLNRTFSIVTACVVFVVAMFLPSTCVSAASPDNSECTYYEYDASSGAYVGEYTLLSLSTLSSSSSASVAVVYGDDDRVLDYTKNGVVKLMASSYYIGTGFIIDEHTIATAAHCVASSSASATTSCGNTVTKIYCFDGSNTVDKTVTGLESIHIPANYFTEGANSAYDYALIIVEEDLSDYMCFSLGTMLDGYSSTVSVTGFPSSITNSDGSTTEKNSYSDHYQYTGSGVVKDYTTSKIYYTADTSESNSGSPVYVITSFNGNVYYTVIAIHTTGGGYNSGVRITPAILHFCYNNLNL
ncbi:MAG: trypsin-like peptidase domain-containing protein [Ruminococcus sp.]|nr:trypsin-like peptidase domain-containing protein [Ruminococcus sp.]